MLLLQGPKKGVRSLAFSPQGDTLFAGYYDGWIRSWHLTTCVDRKFVSVGLTPKFLISDSQGLFSATKSSAYCCDNDGKLSRIGTSTTDDFGTGCLSFDHSTLYVPERKAIRRWNTASHEELPVWQSWSPGHLATSPDGKWIASTHPAHPLSEGDVHHVAIRDVQTGEVLSRIEDQPEYCDGIAFSPSGDRLAVVKHQSLWVWEWPSCRVVCTHRFRKFLTGLAYSPDGGVLATSGNDGVVRFWDGDSGQPLEAYDWQIDKVLCVAVAPDAFRAAAGGANGGIVVWDLE